MRAYNGDLKIKEFYLARVRAHEAADEIVHGRYWENGKGCAVGCTIHGSRHVDYETKLGIPRMLARLEDCLFEGMANGCAKKFPAKFLSVIRPGADLSRVGWKFLHWLLTEELVGRNDSRVAEKIRACADVLVPLTEGQPANMAEARKASGEARAYAAYAAESAAYAAAADSAAAESAAAADSAAADSAAYAVAAAAYAAESAESAAYAAVAYAAAYAADSAGSADSAAADSAAAYAAYVAARLNAHRRMADKLLELLAVE